MSCKVGGIVVLSMNLVPNFGLIHCFDVDTYYIVCEELVTLCFQSHFHSYKVMHKESMNFSFSETSSLIDHNVIGLYNRSGSNFVILIYYLLKKYR